MPDSSNRQYLKNGIIKLPMNTAINYVSAFWGSLNPTLKRHLSSAATTFLTGFVIGVLPYLENLDASALGAGAIFAIFLTGIRAGFKLVIEKLVKPKYQAPVTEALG